MPYAVSSRRFVNASAAVLLAACGGNVEISGPDAGGTDMATDGKAGSESSGGVGGTGGQGTAGRGGAGGTVSTDSGSAGSAAGGAAGATGGSAGSATGGAAGATAGSGGSGGSAPDNPGPYYQALRQPPKVDLLFMIDNTRSMADKQALLGDALPELVDHFVNPPCIDPSTGVQVAASNQGLCTIGVLAYPPMNDVHVGVISSSLGAAGASPNVCDDAYDNALGVADPHNNDRGHLIARGPNGSSVPTYVGKGFLYFNPTLSSAIASSVQLRDQFKALTTGAGLHGCGYGAPLESVYRFLIDPEPYDTLKIDTSVGGFGQAVLSGTDNALLQQRSDFLRSDSLVSVVMITDEDDCAVQAGNQGFYALLPPISGTGKSVLQHGTSACLTNPNDECCYNCGQSNPPAGCAPPAGDPECAKGQLTIAEDPESLRCYDQKRKYGMDFQYPVQRYIDGFTSQTVLNRTGQAVANPLFGPRVCSSSGSCVTTRPRNRVFLTGIVGVPWQDIAINAADLGPGYKTARQLESDGSWNVILGAPDNAFGPVLPTDPRMIRSIAPRKGLPGPETAANADSIVGHEHITAADTSPDLQYACTYPLTTPINCDGAIDCDCAFSPDERKNPLCQDPTSGTYSKTQLRAKAYPASRILQVLRGVGDQGVVGSICAANTTDRGRVDYGFNPTLRAVTDKISSIAKTECTPDSLNIDATGRLQTCSLIDVYEPATGATCDCQDENSPSRRPAPAAALTDEMRAKGSCRCLIPQVDMTSIDRCRAGKSTQPGETPIHGWCYVDPAQNQGIGCNAVTHCASDEKHGISYMSTESQAHGTTYLSCTSDPRIASLPSPCP